MRKHISAYKIRRKRLECLKGTLSVGLASVFGYWCFGIVFNSSAVLTGNSLPCTTKIENVNA